MPSPFDYPSQAAIFVPTDLPPPNDPNHNAEVAQLAADSVRQLGGRTMVLTASLRALWAIGANLIETFEGTNIAVRRTQASLAGAFLLGCRGGQVWVRSGGVCILLGKCEFARGYVAARRYRQAAISIAWRSIGSSPFPAADGAGAQPLHELFSSKGIDRSASGAGRQIRRESDCGILVMGDARLANKGYGRRILATRPPMRRMNDLAAYHEALEALTRASTKVARAA